MENQSNFKISLDAQLKTALLLLLFVSDIEAMPEEEADVTLGIVQWRLMSYQGLEKLLDITHLLFTKVRGGPTSAESPFPFILGSFLPPQNTTGKATLLAVNISSV